MSVLITGHPMVIILCATFNREKYISERIEIFLAQKTTFAFEIIIHDHASPHATSSIKQDFSDH
jgi:glycosyltransferase involved in cell wall biosynthesis